MYTTIFKTFFNDIKILFTIVNISLNSRYNTLIKVLNNIIKKVNVLKNIYLIDNHTHGAFGINFNYATYDETKFLLKELYKRNIRGICPTLVGESDEKIQQQLKLFKNIKDEQLKNIKDETLILGVHLEGSFLSPNKAGIQDKKVFKTPNVENFLQLCSDFSSIVKIVTIAPEEDKGLIDYLNKNNIITQAGHSIGSNIKNCIGTTHHFNAMNPIHHRTPTITLEGLIKDEIYIELIADLIHCSNDILRLALKTKPKGKIILISDSLPSANYDNDIIFCNKKINKFGKDEFGTLAGSNKTLDSIAKNLIEKEILTEEDITLMGFKNQIEYLKLTQEEIDILNR